MEFVTEQFGLATREVFSGSVSQTEEIIEKHSKVMDKLDKKKKVTHYHEDKAVKCFINIAGSKGYHCKGRKTCR